MLDGSAKRRGLGSGFWSGRARIGWPSGGRAPLGASHGVFFGVGRDPPGAETISRMGTMLYLTEILGLPVYDSAGKKIGRVAELAAVPAMQPPRVALLLIQDGRKIPTLSVPL